MAEFSNLEKYDIFCTYLKCRKNATLAQEEYLNTYPERRQPTYKTFKRLDQNLREHGTFSQRRLKRDQNGEPKEIRGEMAVLARVNMDGKISTRGIQAQDGIPKSTVSKILRKHKYYPYKFNVSQTLLPGDSDRRMNFCRWYVDQNVRDANFYKRILWTDEANFSNCGLFNRKNTHFWTQENPHLTVPRRNQVRFSFNVWCGIIGDRLIGPVFYDGTLTSERYLHYLLTAIEDKLDDLPLAVLQSMWYQQDGAPPHNANVVINYLQQKFANRIISTRSVVAWPPRSPDLTPLDFYLWGYIKDQVYGQENYNTLEELQQAVQRAFDAIDRRTLRKVVRSTLRRCQMCLEHDGGVFEFL